jgi:diguanylate cyclase (GGDEF)-like protein
MLAGMLQRRAVTRAALSGLAFGFATLAVLALLGTVSIQRTLIGVHAANEVSNVWDHTLVQVSVESEAMSDYLRVPEDGVEPLASLVGSAWPEVNWLERHRTDTDANQVTLVHAVYESLTSSLRGLVDAARRGDQSAVGIQAAQASLGAAALRKQLTSAILLERIRLAGYLGRVGRDTGRLRTAAMIVIGVDVVLLLVCAALLLAYQGRIERYADSSRHQAQHDVLTGLANRMLLDERLPRAVAQAKETGEPVALLLLDLDGFKRVNDTLGHHYGDLLLKQVAVRLTATLRSSDLVARLGGDEFAMLLSGVGSVDRALAVAEDVLTAIGQPIDLDGMPVDVAGSIGVALCPNHSSDGHQLMQHADIAMYSAKRGHLGVAAYADPMNDHSPSQFALLGELRRAIERGELVLHYQPKARTDTGDICGVEALVRWQHPTRGLLMPGEFVPLAEQNGLMNQLTDHVLAVALEQSRSWLEEGFELPVAVNIGARCLVNPTFPDEVAARLAQAGLPPEMLTLEITETALISDQQRALEVFVRLRELGVRLSIDDFGTGYSSMTYLTTMPVHELKIDRSFVSDMRQDASKKVIVRAIVSLAHALGLAVVAEGVEDAQTWAELVAIGCGIAQGYYLQRPMPATILSRWLAGRTNDALVAR